MKKCPSPLQGTLTPFLYPFLYPFLFSKSSKAIPTLVQRQQIHTSPASKNTSLHDQLAAEPEPEHINHLNPPPSDYSRPVFADKAAITIHAGAGGHGCISFVREKYIPAGPANGGDGGSGGNIYIQAVRGETSLHKLARRTIIKAGRGRNGQGKTRGGERGSDIVLQVPVGTVVREVERDDPVANEELKRKIDDGRESGSEAGTHTGPYKWSREKWLLYPAITPEDIKSAEFPRLPRARRSALAMSQPKSPIALDLSQPMEAPMLLAAGAVGGLGNPHFVTREVPRPKYATKGEAGMNITLELELKLLADVGLVGLPNAGKSTLLRAISNSRARVGDWEFTTLQPNIGTVVLDDHKGHASTKSFYDNGDPRTSFTIADIPGLVKDAHLDRGLGISFLRHVERAGVLAFVIDLNAGDAVEALKALWKEVGAYEKMKREEEVENKEMTVHWSPFETVDDAINNKQETIVMSPSMNIGLDGRSTPAMMSIANKQWFVVATKADLPGTIERYEALKAYVRDIQEGVVEHPSGQSGGWAKRLEVIPISAINGHGTERIVEWIVGLLDAQVAARS